MFRQSIDGAHVRGRVNSVITRAGDERQIEWTDAFIHNSAGQPVGILAIGSDVTERMATREALRSSEERLAEAQRQAGVGSGEFDLRAGTNWWSDEQYRINGIPVGTPVSEETFLKLIHLDDRPAFDAAFTVSLEAGQFEGEFRASAGDSPCDL